MLEMVIVEDEDILREGLVSYVDWEKLGYRVVGAAADGIEGLQVIQKTHPDVVLTDIRMPHMDGIEMIEKLREGKEDISIVIISGYEDFEYARNALKLGVKEYILKPLNIKQLEQTMTKLYQVHMEKIQNKKEYMWLKSREDYNRQQMHKNLLLQVLSQRNLKEEDRRLLEEMKDIYFVVIIASKESFSLMTANYDYLELVEIDRNFEKDLMDTLSEFEEIVCVRNSLGERILCGWGMEKQLLLQALNKIESIFSQNNVKKMDVVISGGMVVQGIQSLEKSLKIARERQAKEYQKALEGIVKVECDRENAIKYMSFEAADLFTEIKIGNYRTVEREILKLEEKLKKGNVVSHMHLLLVVTNLYADLMKLPDEVGSSADEVFENPMELYKRTVTSIKQEDMFQNLKEICFKLNDFFKEVNQGKFDYVLDRALEYIHKEFGNPDLQIKDVAKASYVSNSYLSLIIKQGTGKTYVEYLTDIRMDQAKKLLGETELKSYEIAEACGFANPAYFSTVFKSVFGMSPSAYKKEKKVI